MKRYSNGLNDRLKSGWVDDVRIRYSSLGARVNREVGSDSVCRCRGDYDSRQRSWRQNPREVLRLCRAPAKSAGKAKARDSAQDDNRNCGSPIASSYACRQECLAPR